MRYIKARQEHICATCKEIIPEGEICIQSTGTYRWIYHEECHRDRFEGSFAHEPANERPE